MPAQVIWPRCNIFGKDDVPTVFERGEIVPDKDIDPAQMETLLVIGAVQMVDLRSGSDDTESDDSGEPETPELLEKPSPDDPKPAWVAFASDERNPDRMSRNAAESMSKPALMARFP